MALMDSRGSYVPIFDAPAGSDMTDSSGNSDSSGGSSTTEISDTGIGASYRDTWLEREVEEEEGTEVRNRVATRSIIENAIQEPDERDNLERDIVATGATDSFREAVETIQTTSTTPPPTPSTPQVTGRTPVNQPAPPGPDEPEPEPTLADGTTSDPDASDTPSVTVGTRRVSLNDPKVIVAGILLVAVATQVGGADG